MGSQPGSDVEVAAEVARQGLSLAQHVGVRVQVAAQVRVWLVELAPILAQPRLPEQLGLAQHVEIALLEVARSRIRQSVSRAADGPANSLAQFDRPRIPARCARCAGYPTVSGVGACSFGRTPSAHPNGRHLPGRLPEEPSRADPRRHYRRHRVDGLGAFHLAGKEAYDKAIDGGPEFIGPPDLEVVRMVEEGDDVISGMGGVVALGLRRAGQPAPVRCAVSGRYGVEPTVVGAIGIHEPEVAALPVVVRSGVDDLGAVGRERRGEHSPVLLGKFVSRVRPVPSGRTV